MIPHQDGAAGRTVLVTGGAGAVGHYAVQLAKWAGATVIATVSSPDKAARAAEAGADQARDDAVRDITALVEAGRLLHVIGARFPLERIVEAHQAQESGKVIGNIVVDIAPDGRTS